MQADFDAVMERKFAGYLMPFQHFAVAVSGGPDSMALCNLLSDWAARYRPQTVIHAITVDHKLRAESGQEAVDVGQALRRLNNVRHHILVWQHEDMPDTRLQERARAARYELLLNFMCEEGLAHIFLGHHLDDQAETFLFRLAKGSGLDGLAGMEAMREAREGLWICRPMLEFTKTDILSYCNNQGIWFVEDPSNKMDKFARVRMRAVMDNLVSEGLTAQRLGVTAERLSRARTALEVISKKVFQECLISKQDGCIVFDGHKLGEKPQEILLRVVLLGMAEFPTDKAYGPRLERIEDLCSDMMKPDAFRRRTLNGLIFERNDKSGEIILTKEG